MQKTALVTGGNSGIGYATAKLLKEKEYKVIISGRNKQGLEKAAKDIGVDFILCDMSDLEDIKKLASNFLENRLDILINNAGISEFTPIAYANPIDWKKITDTNLLGPIILIKELLPALEKSKGAIVNVSSVCAICGVPQTYVYSAAKAGLEAITRVFAAELAPKQIRVNTVSPGFCDTKMPKMSLTSEQYAKFKHKVEKEKILLQRFGTPEEVAHVIVAQAQATYVTGSVWIVDGGISAAA